MQASTIARCSGLRYATFDALPMIRPCEIEMGQFFLFPPLCPIKALKSYSEFGGDSGLRAAEKFSKVALAQPLTNAIGSQSWERGLRTSRAPVPARSGLQRHQELAAEKFTNVPPAAHLTKAIGTQSKLFELLVLDADDVQELAAGGEVRGLDMDGIAGASVS